MTEQPVYRATRRVQHRLQAMTRIAHLSDIHFGANDLRIINATESWLIAQRPDLVVISGDLTQRAKVEQFQGASAYLNRLRSAGLKILVVPGNHDVPLYDVMRRFFAPLHRYEKYISNDLSPWFENDEVAVLGLNTARSLTIKSGRINHQQLDMIHERFARIDLTKMRILVTHHPLYAMPIGRGGELSEAIGRHDDAVRSVCEAGVHIALAGHFHRTYAEAPSKMVEHRGRALIMQAGTATSTRLRNEEPQSFNWLHVEQGHSIELQVIAWSGTGFLRTRHVKYDFDGQGWSSRDVHDGPAVGFRPSGG